MGKYEKFYNQLKPWLDIFDEQEFLNFLEELEIDLSEDKHNFLNASTQNMNWISNEFKDNIKLFKMFFNYFKNINLKSLTYILEKNYENFKNEYNIKKNNFNDELINKLIEIERYEIQNSEMILEIRKKMANIGETKFDVNEHQMAKLKLILKEVVDKINQLENIINQNNDDIKDLLLDNNKIFDNLRPDFLESSSPKLNLKLRDINEKITDFYKRYSVAFLILMFFLGVFGSWVMFK
ncbi:hypothetical protein [Thomasclavelia cocleata]|jgi:hypothetical protein|uniref:hypothetical protein n=1 Tax=Thomasclavelia cocleata TaxID=69824 RepID=UPI002431F6F8|nr:hypothetical protein [Thomasclavelia cocleata]